MTAEYLAILMSWAASLSGYPPSPVPPVQFVEHSFFVEHACFGLECRVVGWYNDQNVVYIDRRYNVENDWFAASLVVHELLHHLQHQSGKFGNTCEDFVAREREAYRVQARFVQEAMSRIEIIRPKIMGCPKEG